MSMLIHGAMAMFPILRILHVPVCFQTSLEMEHIAPQRSASRLACRATEDDDVSLTGCQAAAGGLAVWRWLHGSDLDNPQLLYAITRGPGMAPCHFVVSLSKPAATGTERTFVLRGDI